MMEKLVHATCIVLLVLTVNGVATARTPVPSLQDRQQNDPPLAPMEPESHNTDSHCSSYCMQGPPGPPGSPGNPGAAGMPGIPGNHGQNGMNGIPGNHGAKGDAGEQGPPGNQGESGPAENAGIQGRSGERGAPGEQEANLIASVKDEVKFNSAFSAARMTTLVAPKNKDINIPYEHIFINIGSNLDPIEGIYTAPRHGAYMFLINIHMASTTNSPYVKLMHNNQMLVSVHDYDASDAYDSASNSLIIELQDGDKVWLQLDQGNEVHSNSNRYTTFSGNLLFELP